MNFIIKFLSYYFIASVRNGLFYVQELSQVHKMYYRDQINLNVICFFSDAVKVALTVNIFCVACFGVQRLLCYIIAEITFWGFSQTSLLWSLNQELEVLAVLAPGKWHHLGVVGPTDDKENCWLKSVLILRTLKPGVVFDTDSDARTLNLPQTLKMVFLSMCAVTE